MKRINYIVCALLMHLAPLLAHRTPVDHMSDLCSVASDCTLEVDEGIRTACRMLTEHMQDPHSACPELSELLSCGSGDIDAKTALLAMQYCIELDCCSQTDELLELRNRLAACYEELLSEYRAFVVESGTRRIRVKFFNKVTTGELVVTNRAFVKDANIQGNLMLRDVTGAVIANGGLITTGQIPATAIPNGAITNPKLAPNAVNTSNIVPMSITPALLAFNTVQTFSGEPDPLQIYRGTVTGATGAVTSGSGFMVTRTAAGAYTVTITGPAYASNATYQVFIQLFSETNPVTLVRVSGTQFTVNTVVDHDFSFFTIGN